MADVKFSQFTAGAEVQVGDVIVGLRPSTPTLNYKFTFPATGIKDSSGNYLFQYASAGALSVNYLKLVSSLTTNAALLTADGADTDIDISIVPKGSGVIFIDGIQWPASPGAVGEFLYMQSSGVLGFTTGSVALSVQGTANQVLVNGTSGTPETGAVILTTPQDIGTASTPTFSGLTLSATPLNPTSGGTNQSTYALGDMLYSSAVNTLSKLAGNTTAVKLFLSQTGTGAVSAAPIWSAIAGTDIPGAALTKTDDTNVTLTLGGTPTTSLLRPASLTLGWAGQLSIARGGTNRSTLPTTAVASSYSAWDVNSNLYANNVLESFTSTVSAAGTTTLTVASTYIQEITGSTTQTIQMPVASTLVTGTSFKIINNSSGNITLTSSGGNTILVMAGNTTAFITCVLASGTTAASWNSSYVFDNGAGVLSITGTANQVIASASTGAVTLSLPQDIGTSSAVQFASVKLSSAGILDSNGATSLAITATASAVNFLNLVNQATGFRPGFVAAGSDTNIDIGLTTKGTGQLVIVSQNLTNPLLITNGTGAQHSTNFIFANTAATRNVTFPDATGTLLMTGQAISTVPSIAFSSTSGVIGTTTNDNSAAGSVGEYISSSVLFASRVSVTTGTSKTITSISLTAGDWDVQGVVVYVPAVGTTTAQASVGISTTDNTLPTVAAENNYSALGTSAASIGCAPNVGSTRISIGSTTTVYIVANATFAVSTMQAYGFIGARRVR